MTYGRCKCGGYEFWGSGMNPSPCSPCDKCGTIPASHPEYHPEPVPHEFNTHNVETDAGPQPLSRCRWCLKTKQQIEKGTK